MKTISAMAAIGLIPWVVTQAFGEWSTPVRIRSAPDDINTPRLGAGASGTALALWHESARAPGRFLSRMTSAGPWGWGPSVEVSDGTALLQPPEAMAMHTDGTVVAAWRQVIDSPFESQIVVRKFVPGSGWGPIHKVSVSGIAPTLAFAPDGRAHLVFRENRAFVATTLGPGEDTWAPTVVLTDDVNDNGSGQAAVVAGPGFAYAAYPTGVGVDLAAYDAGGWHRGKTVSSLGSGSFPELAINGAHTALTWSSLDGQHVLRLTGPDESFTMPRSNCKLSLSPDGTATAICRVEGEAVPGCFEPARGGPRQLYYNYLEAYRRAPFGEWSPVEAISSRQKRVRFDARLLSNSAGAAFVFWDSEVPCGPGSAEIFARTWSPQSASWEPEERLFADRAPAGPLQAINSNLVDATVDAEGAPHALILHFETDYQTDSTSSELFVLDGTAPEARQAKGSK